ncbi:MAG TPA: hypothetical protein VI055_14855 [Rubrobacter sp.]|jgi:hypothetical protein
MLGTGSSLLSIGRSAPAIQGTSLAHRATTLSASSWYMSPSQDRGPWCMHRDHTPHIQRPLRQPECV